jgi:hypothetical protein
MLPNIFCVPSCTHPKLLFALLQHFVYRRHIFVTHSNGERFLEQFLLIQNHIGLRVSTLDYMRRALGDWALSFLIV